MSTCLKPSENANVKSLLSSVRCKTHESSKLMVDLSTFQIKCKECKSSHNLIFNTHNSDSDSSNSLTFCYIHKEDEGSFFCLDCNEFICSLCISTKHRYHASSIPSELKEVIINNTNQLSNVISLIIQDTEGVKNELLTFKNDIDELKMKVTNRVQLLSSFISKEITNKSNELILSIPEIINSKQETLTEQYLARCNSDLRKIYSFLDVYETLRNIINKGFYINNEISRINKIDTTVKDKSLSGAIVFIKDKINIAQEILDRTKEINSETDEVTENYYTLIENKVIYNETIDTKIKEINNIFDAINSSLQTSYIQRNYSIRRFTSYFNPGVIFFEKTSVYIDNLNDFPIKISGFGLCGLISTKDRCTLNVELSILELPDYEKDNTENNDEKKYLDKIPYLVEDSHLILLYKERLLLKEIDFTNSNNPTQTVYLSKYTKDPTKAVVELKANRKYKIKITNVDSDYYVNIWNGKTITKDFISMFKEKKTSYLSQELICNTNDIAIGVSSSDSTDLNEFSNGIISDIIYCL